MKNNRLIQIDNACDSGTTSSKFTSSPHAIQTTTPLVNGSNTITVTGTTTGIDSTIWYPSTITGTYTPNPNDEVDSLSKILKHKMNAGNETCDKLISEIDDSLESRAEQLVESRKKLAKAIEEGLKKLADIDKDIETLDNVKRELNDKFEINKTLSRKKKKLK